MHLTGPQLKTFRDALKLAFSKGQLELLLSDRLDRNLDDISGGGDRDVVFRDVLVAANAEGWLLELALAVRAERPAKTELRLALEALGLLTRTDDLVDLAAQRRGEGPGAAPTLEKILVAANAALDVQVWRERLTIIEGQVCRIVFGQGGAATPLGSGFLVGPSAVLTNQHVVAKARTGQLDPSVLRVQFDYRVLSDGSTQAGSFVPLAASWLIDAEPHDPADLAATPLTQDTQPGMLDYALLRLAHPVGREPIGAKSDAGELPARGWIDLTTPGPAPAVDAPLFILQHPDGNPMKLALDTQAVIGTSPSGRRIRYRTNTEPGSSGSPVFDQRWQIVALHHLGDPRFGVVPQYNQGIPIPAITAHLAAKGTLAALAL